MLIHLAGCAARTWRRWSIFFLCCPIALAVWYASSLALRVERYPTFHQFWGDILQIDDEEVVAMVQCVLYQLWEARNRSVFNQQHVSINQLTQKVGALASAAIGVVSHPQSRQVAAVWKRPALDQIKINCDASFRAPTDVGLGMVARNSSGEVMASATSSSCSVLSSLLAEASCLRWAMSLAIDLGFRQVIFEVDCLQLFKAWRAGVAGRNYLATIISDCRRLSLHFDSAIFTFTRRSGNSVADYLARNASTYGESVWVEEVPPGAIRFVDSDCLASLPA